MSIATSSIPKFHVLIPAAGNGSRMGADLPKQYLPLGKQVVLWHTLQVFLQCPRIAGIYVVLSAEDAYWDKCCGDMAGVTVLRCGGETRAQTVLNGLQHLPAAATDWVLVHDAARPGLSLTMLDGLLDSLHDDAVGGLLAIPVADTLKRADAQKRVAATEPREHLWQAQTPQMFPYALLKAALTAAGGKPTDEAQAIEALGYQPKLVLGGMQNLKITYPQDLALMQILLAQPKL